jgi:hypothetical protein
MPDIDKKICNNQACSVVQIDQRAEEIFGYLFGFQRLSIKRY